MRLLPFGSFLVLVPLWLNASACGDGDLVRHPNAAGAGGAHNAGSSSGGEKSTAGRASMGGNTPQAGEASEIEGGAAGQSSGGDAAAGGVDSSENCGEVRGISMLGDYVDPNGDRWWLRDSGKATTLVHVPAGKPTNGKPPSLWQVLQVCRESSALLLETPSGTFTRLDYVAGAKSLTLCLASSTVAALKVAAELPAADRANTIDSGCNGGPWLRVVKEEK